MRILVLTVFKNVVTWGYAPTQVAFDFINAVQRYSPNVFVELPLPTKGQDHPPQFHDQSRVRFHYMDMVLSGIVEQAMLTRDLWDKFSVNRTTVAYDAVLNWRVMTSPLLKKALKAKYERFSVDVPLFNTTTRVPVAGDRYRAQKYNYFGEDEIMGELMGYLMDYSVVLLDEEKRLAMQEGRRYMNPATLKKMDERMMVAAIAGVRTADIDKLYDQRDETSDRPPCLFWGGRWVSQKGFSDMLELCKRIYSTGRDIRFVFTTAEDRESEIVELKEKYPYIEFYDKVNREEFMKKMIEGDVFICLSKVESFGCAYWEMAYAGLVGVFVDAAFSREVLPDGYPYFAKNNNELLEKTLWVLSNLSSARDWLDKIRDRIRDKYDVDKEDIRVFEWMKEEVAKKRAPRMTGSGSLAQLVKDALKGEDGPISMTDVCQRMKKASIANRDFGRKGDIMNSFYIRETIMSAGFDDLCDRSEPYFVRRK